MNSTPSVHVNGYENNYPYNTSPAKSLHHHHRHLQHRSPRHGEQQQQQQQRRPNHLSVMGHSVDGLGQQQMWEDPEKRRQMKKLNKMLGPSFDEMELVKQQEQRMRQQQFRKQRTIKSED
jgi:hypothetical protein